MRQGTHSGEGPRLRMKARFCIVLALIILTTLYVRYFRVEEIALPEKVLQEFPLEIGEWKGVADYKFNDEVVRILKVSDYLERRFEKDSKKVDLYIGYYNTHRRFPEIHTPENCQVGGGWEIISQKVRQLNTRGVEGGKIIFTEAVYEKDRTKQLFLYWYLVNGNNITNFFRYKLNVILNSIIKNRSDAAFIRVSVPIINGDVNDAVIVGEAFLAEILPILNHVLSNKTTIS